MQVYVYSVSFGCLRLHTFVKLLEKWEGYFESGGGGGGAVAPPTPPSLPPLSCD